MANPNPLSTPLPWNLVAEGYADVTMAMLGEYAKDALAEANVSPRMRALDVACGPGTVALMVAQKVKMVDALDFSPRMVALLEKECREKNIDNINPIVGDGQTLPYADNSFDIAFSMFGLIFFPDRAKGFSELHRTLKAGGRAFVTSWAPVSRSPLMQVMMEAIKVIMPEATSAPGKAIASLEDPGNFKFEMQQAGFRNVTVRPLTKHTAVKSIDEFWAEMVKGTAPLVLLKDKVGESAWKRKEKRVLEVLKEKLPALPCSLSSDAWLGIGEKK